MQCWTRSRRSLPPLPSLSKPSLTTQWPRTQHTLAAAQRARASADALIYSYVQTLQRPSAALTTAYYDQRFKEDLRHAYAVDIMIVVVCVSVHTLS